MPTDTREALHEVYEIHGGAWASYHGVDVRVCRNWEEFKDALSEDTDEMQVGDELRIVYTEYTQQQMEEVAWND